MQPLAETTGLYLPSRPTASCKEEPHTAAGGKHWLAACIDAGLQAASGATRMAAACVPTRPATPGSAELLTAAGGTCQLACPSASPPVTASVHGYRAAGNVQADMRTRFTLNPQVAVLPLDAAPANHQVADKQSQAVKCTLTAGSSIAGRRAPADTPRSAWQRSPGDSRNASDRVDASAACVTSTDLAGCGARIHESSMLGIAVQCKPRWPARTPRPCSTASSLGSSRVSDRRLRPQPASHWLRCTSTPPKRSSW